MTATEKADLFQFLSTAQGWISGYRSQEKIPEFFDSPSGKPTIPVLIIGNPLTTEANSLLNKMLCAIDLEPSKNCVLIYTETVSLKFLEEEILKNHPYTILLLGKNFNLFDIKNTTFVNFHGIPLFAIENPEKILQNSELKRPVWEDLKFFKTQLNRFLAEEI